MQKNSFLISLLLFFLPLPTVADALNGKVINITDGNTIHILDDSGIKHKIRLAGIDAPGKGQDFGTNSRQHLGSLIHGKEVLVEFIKRDRKGRIVGTVFFEDYGDVNLEMVRAGMAWWFWKYRNEQSTVDQLLYEHAQRKARSERRGLWSHPHPMPPWEWRNR